MTTFRAFRILGRFAWPPMPKDAKAASREEFEPLEAGKIRDGLVEIFYRDNGADDNNRVLMRWTSKASDTFAEAFRGTSDLPEGEIENLWRLDDEQLAERIKALGEKDSITLDVSDPPDAAALEKGRRLIFQGATVLDQFEPAGSDDKPVDADGTTIEKAANPASRRFALVRSAQLDEKVQHSTVMFGQPKNRNFRFDLIVPAPVQPGAEEDFNIASFSLVYTSQAPASEHGSFNTLTVQGQPIGTEISLQHLSEKRLGRFGFSDAAGTNKESNYFVEVSTTANNWKEFWAAGKTLTAPGLFGKLGIGTDASPQQVRNPTAAQRSLHFPEAASAVGGQQFSVSSRVSFSFEASSVKPPFVKKNKRLAIPFAGAPEFYFPEIGDLFIATFDILYQVEVRDDDLIKDVMAQGSATMRVSMVWPETVSDSLGIKGSEAPPITSSFTHALHHAILCMRESRADLQNLNTPESVSVLPELSVERTQNVVAALMNAEETGLSRKPNGAPKWLTDGKGAVPRLTVLPEERHLRADFADPLKLVLRCYLPGFQANPSIKYAPNQNDHHALTLDHDPSVQSVSDQADAGFFRLRLEEVKHKGPQLIGQIGSLEFSRSGSDEADEKLLVPGDQKNFSHLRLGVRTDKYEPNQTAAGTFKNQKFYDNQIAIDLKLRLTMDAVVPVVADGSDDAPILIPLGKTGLVAGEKTVARYILEVEELLSDRRERSLKARLYDRDESSSRDAFALIGGRPWTVMGFSMASLGSRGDEGGLLVAEYDSRTAAWTLVEADAVYQYELPPMVTGDSADKPGRMEILDRNDADNNPSPVRSGTEGRQRFAVESRFGPSTALWIDPEDRQKSSIPAPWDISALFNRQQIGGLGVALRGLQAEFLYGISAAVDPQITRRNARVNTTDSVVGLPMEELLVSSPDPQVEERWERLRRSYNSRPHRLELTEANAADTLSFPLARFDREVTFALRKTALHRPPTGDDLEDIFDATDIDNGTTKNLRFHPRGLSGGALWPIEQRNLLRALQHNPASSGGSLEQVAMSPVGGDADQEARFLNGQVSVISRTRSGFVERYRVEVIGRIACYWHRAKHVVVYERTVNPSAQFAPGKGSQRSRRPILRKMAEFIEILQPLRTYPDTPGAAPKATGPLEAVRYNSVVINVDSSWSRDLGKWGWQIPLWNRHAAVVKPDVYPLPDVAFITRSEGEEGASTTAQECRNPEHMSFVADFSRDGADTDLWPIRVGVDTRIGPAPGTTDADTLDKHVDSKGKETNPRRASVTRTPLGARRFTALLAPSSVKTRLNAHRSDKPIYVNLESLTFMRSQPGGEQQDVSKAVAGLASHQSGTLKDFGYWSDGGEAPSPFVGVEKAFKELRGLLDEPFDETEFDAKRKAVTDTLGTLDLEQQLGALLGNNHAALKDNLKEAKKLLGSTRGFCNRLKDETQATVKGKQLLVLERLRAGRADIDEVVDALEGSIPKSKVENKLVQAVRKEIMPAFDRASQDVGSIGNDVETARAILADVLVDWRATLAVTRSRVDELHRQYDRNKPESKSRIDAFGNKLEGLLSGLSGDIRTAVEEASQRLSTEVSSIGDTLSASLAAELKRMASHEIAPSLSLPGTVIETVDEAVVLVRDYLKEVLNRMEAAGLAAGRVIDDIAKKVGDNIGALEEFLNGETQDGLLDQIMGKIVTPAVKAILVPFPEKLELADQQEKDKLRRAVDGIEAELARFVDAFTGEALAFSDDIEKVCSEFGDHLDQLLGRLENSQWLIDLKSGIGQALDQLKFDTPADDLLAQIENIGGTIRDLGNTVAKTGALAENYKNKVIEQLGEIGRDGVEAVPGNLLALYSTATSAPELAGLKVNVDRIRNNLDALKDVIDTTEAEAMFDLLGDRLKALGLSIPFNQLGDALISRDVGADGITKYLKNLCGFDVSRLLPRAKVPGKLKDAVKITHDFDKKAKRAWVQVDVRFALPGRETLFSFGPFQMDFVDTRLTATVRIEASADSKEIEENGSARIDTNVEALVGGEKMVAIEKLAMTYSDKQGLEFELKPENVKLNRILQFVQDALAGLFPDDIGGLEFVKEGGVPVGVEYAFMTPVLDSNAVTSGIQNIQIGNTIRLVAYPDFKLTNSFSFCTPEKPFIFSFFILGGTGYVLVDADYRPFGEQLTVLVTAGAGASASLAFAFGPVSGSVYITLSVVLKFRKLIGRSDSSDLTIGLSLVVAGKVDVCGIVSIFLMLGLDLLYRSDGRIDANGRLILKIRISRFFKIKVRTDVKYRLRGGKSETVVNTSSKVSTDDALQNKLETYKKSVSQL